MGRVSLTISIIALLLAGYLAYTGYQSDQRIEEIVREASIAQDSLRQVKMTLIDLERNLSRQDSIRDSIYQSKIDQLSQEQIQLQGKINKSIRDVKNLEAKLRPVSLPEF